MERQVAKSVALAAFLRSKLL
eukprot:SAG11_NODE_22755_length_400_cov_2.053156_1_plen_20_part_01